jgi:ribokinase
MKSLHVGSAMIDIITLIASENIERATFTNDGKSFLMLEAGRKLVAEQITSHVGGGACNTAVSLARRGWDSGVLAKVGEDLNAAEIRKHLAENDVADRMVLSDRSTGTAVMVASHDRNASIFVHRGANETLDCAEFPDGLYDGLDLVYVTSLSNASADCFPVILQGAKAAGAMTAANPGIRQLTSRTAEFLAALAHVDLLSINTVEAEALVPAFAPRAEGPDPVLPDGAPPLARRGLSFGGFEMGVIRFLRAVQAAGPSWVSLTDGTDGAYLATPEGVLWHPTVPADVAGTAGAGDAFCSTLTAALIEGKAAGAAMREAAINAASVVSHVDTTTGLLAPEALQAENDRLPEMPVLDLTA